MRCGVVESVHRGSAVVTRPDGSVEQAWGDPSGLIFPRSASKPIQAAAMVAAGLDVPPHQLALVCASHSGEAFHLATALEILHGAGLTEGHLRNTPDYPVDDLARDEWIRAGHPKTSLAQNCSGKHSGMLATAAANGWDLEGYLDPEHPLQRAITDAVARLSGTPVGAMAVDGCGAPLHGIPLAGLAHAFGRIAAAAAGTTALTRALTRALTTGRTGPDGRAHLAPSPGPMPDGRRPGRRRQPRTRRSRTSTGRS